MVLRNFFISVFISVAAFKKWYIIFRQCRFVSIVMHLFDTLYVTKCVLLSARILHSRTGSRGDFQSVIKRRSICNLMEIFWIQIGVCCSVDRSILFPCKFFVTAKICDYKNSFRVEYSLQATLIEEENSLLLLMIMFSMRMNITITNCFVCYFMDSYCRKLLCRKIKLDIKAILNIN